MTFGETWESCLDEIRNLPSVKKYGDDVVVSMYNYDRPSYTGCVYEIECYFPTWAIPKDHKVTKALEDAYRNLYGETRLGNTETEEMRKARPLTDKWTFSTNGVSIMGRNGIPCIGFGPGAEAQAHAPNEKTWKIDLVRCAAVYAALPASYCKLRIISNNINKEIIMKTLQDYIDKLNALNFKEMYNNDFFLDMG